MASTTKQYRAEGKNTELQAPVWVTTQTLTANQTFTHKFLNVAQFLKVKNFGSGVIKVGFNSAASVGVNGSSAANQCYYKVEVGDTLELPAEFGYLAILADASGAEFSAAVTLSEKPVSFVTSTGMEAAGYFDGVESLDSDRYTIS